MPRKPSPLKVITAARDLIAKHPNANRTVARLLVDQLAEHHRPSPRGSSDSR